MIVKKLSNTPTLLSQADCIFKINTKIQATRSVLLILRMHSPEQPLQNIRRCAVSSLAHSQHPQASPTTERRPFPFLSFYSFYDTPSTPHTVTRLKFHFVSRGLHGFCDSGLFFGYLEGRKFVYAVARKRRRLAARTTQAARRCN